MKQLILVFTITFGLMSMNAANAGSLVASPQIAGKKIVAVEKAPAGTTVVADQPTKEEVIDLSGNSTSSTERHLRQRIACWLLGGTFYTYSDGSAACWDAYGCVFLVD